jgi:hypothetical protein
VVVNSGATLGGTGTVGGPVTVNSGGTVSPGDSGPGILSTGGTVTINAGGTLLVEIGGKTAGSGYDRLKVGGIANLGGAISVSVINGFTPAPGDSYQVLTFSSRSGDFTTQSGFTLAGGLTLQEQFSPAGSPTSLNLVVAGGSQTAPTITQNPTSQTVNAGQTATFTAAAGGSPAPAVQWQVSTNGGATWSAIAGATGTMLALANVQAGQNGYEYEAVFTNGAGSATTAAATLFVQADLTAQTAVTIFPFNSSTKQQVVTVRSKSLTAYRGPLALVLNLSPFAQNLGVRLLGAVINGSFVAAHKTSDGRWYVELVPPGGVFNPGQTLNVTLQFSANPLTYTTSVLLGL